MDGQTDVIYDQPTISVKFVGSDLCPTDVI